LTVQLKETKENGYTNHHIVSVDFVP